MRVTFSLLLSLYLSLSLRSIYLRENVSSPRMTHARYRAYIGPLLLPVYCALFPLIASFFGFNRFIHALLTLFFQSFVHISIYHILLLMVFPLLRKHYTARTCAAFWLIPNCLYYVHLYADPLSYPLVVITPPSWLVKALSIIWLFVCLFVILSKCISHIRFRRMLLKDAVPVADPQILDMFRWELIDARIETRRYKLARSAHITTPLSIGFLEKTTWILLPETDYTPGELKLIFRHELIHICRRDSAYKFFMTFCTAICWFNPLTWIAMKRSAEDLELSCDETVLLHTGADSKSKYAELILETAGDQRGFTSCLSVSAKSLKYRLKNILAPAQKKNGFLLLGLVFFLLSSTYGYVALAYDSTPGTEAVFQSEQHHFHYQMNRSELRQAKICTDPDALTDYLASLEFASITGFYNYMFYNHPRHWFFYDGPDGELVVMLEGHRAVVTYPKGDEASGVEYYLPDIDWDYLNTLLD